MHSIHVVTQLVYQSVVHNQSEGLKKMMQTLMQMAVAIYLMRYLAKLRMKGLTEAVKNI